MASKVKVRISNSPGWTLTETTADTGPSTRRRRGALATPVADPFLEKLQAYGTVAVVHTSEVSFGAEARRGAPVPAEPLTAGAVVVEAETAPDELHVLMVRHQSRAITFHFATDVAQSPGRRGARRAAVRTIRFSVSVTPEPADEGSARRGIVTSILKTALLKITGKLADLAMPALSTLWEKAAWGARRQGWKLATQSALQSGQLPVLTDFSKLSQDSSKPNLLLIHGTFSNALDAYKSLATTKGSNSQTLLTSVADLYEDRIFGFAQRAAGWNIRVRCGYAFAWRVGIAAPRGIGERLRSGCIEDQSAARGSGCFAQRRHASGDTEAFRYVRLVDLEHSGFVSG
jgi:hypothetical protein